MNYRCFEKKKDTLHTFEFGAKSESFEFGAFLLLFGHSDF